VRAIPRIALSLGTAFVALVLTYPVVCAGGEFEPVNRCSNIMGLALPGFAYRGDDEYRIYVVPLAVAVLAFLAVWRVARPTAISRS
jgi:hypothetical protein